MTCSTDIHAQSFDKSGGHFKTHVALKKYPLSVIGSCLEVLFKLEGSLLLWDSYR